jgi:LPPG:FO 2-phospho-L-lactate transferase
MGLGMKVTAIAGGVGAARFLRGVVQVVDDLTVVVNTGDDLRIHGLHVSPDLDTIAYTLGGGIHPHQQWGRAEETFTVADELADRYGRHRWFTLGDRDLATHLVRSEILGAGGTLSDATQQIAAAWKLGVTLLPMTDDPVTTRIHTRDGRDLHFQEWWVGEHAEPPVAQVRYAGAEQARPAPGVLDAIAAADLVLLCPSNPVVSIGTVLAVPGIRAALAAPRVVGVSPIVGGAVVRGMADRLLPAVGCAVSAPAVAGLYADILDGWVMDDVDAAHADQVPGHIHTVTTQTVMHDAAASAALAGVAVTLGAALPPPAPGSAAAS